MIVFPYCKINLGLSILRKREDGFHDIESLFYPIPFTDILELISNPHGTKPVEFISSGLMIDVEEEDNLCSKAYHLLKNDFPHLPNVKMHLHKVIPMGAGLGGGSSNASFVLKMLNDKFNLCLSHGQLLNYAIQLGSDCPFFIQNKPCIASGRGELLEPISIDLSNYTIVLINPGIHINTGWAFSKINPSNPSQSIKEIVMQPIINWKDQLLNDFETPIFNSHPPIKSIKESFYQQGALYASLSGSGSTVFGIFDKQQNPILNFNKNYFMKIVN